MKDVKKIDVHTHVTLHKDIAPKLQVTGQSFLSPQEQIDIHRQLNVEKAVLLPLVSPEGQWAIITNEDCFLATKNDPAHFACGNITMPFIARTPRGRRCFGRILKGWKRN